jgi:DNA replication protein DnaC
VSTEDEPKRGPLGGLHAALPESPPSGSDPLGSVLPGGSGTSSSSSRGEDISIRASCSVGVCDGSGWIIGPEDTARPCECRRRRIERARSSGLKGSLPKRYRGVSFDRPPVSEMARQPGFSATVGAVRRYCDTIDEQLEAGHGLWLMGGPGTGKTTLAMLASKAAIDAGRSVAIYSTPALLARIRRTFDAERGEEGYLGFFDRLVSVDLLHLDDLGAERSTDWVLEQLYAIVDRRYNDERSIVFTTNLEEPELTAQIGARTVSRLIEMCDGNPLPLFGQDRRVEMAPGAVPPQPS